MPPLFVGWNPHSAAGLVYRGQVTQTDKNSPIAGRPILEAYKTRTVMVIKRSMSPGFAGIDNDLYDMEKTLMLFGDAKAALTSLVKELSAVARVVENRNGDERHRTSRIRRQGGFLP